MDSKTLVGNTPALFLRLWLCTKFFSSAPLHSQPWKTFPLPAQYLFFALILRYQVERDGVERAGHDAEHAAEGERGDDVGEEANQAGAHAEQQVAHKVQSLQADVWEEETLHIWKHTHVMRRYRGFISPHHNKPP